MTVEAPVGSYDVQAASHGAVADGGHGGQVVVVVDGEERGLQLQLGRGKQLGSMLPTAHKSRPNNPLETLLTH